MIGAGKRRSQRLLCPALVLHTRPAPATLPHPRTACRAVPPCPRPPFQLPPALCHPPLQVGTLEGSTHAYSFWEGVPIEGKAAFGRLFAAAGSLRSVAVVQRAIR